MSLGRNRRLRRRWFVRLVGVALMLATAAVERGARADETAYCRKVQARASADASLLVAPTGIVEALKVPSPQAGGSVDATLAARGYQVRAAVSLSPVDFYKGLRVAKVADADCAQHESVMTAEQLLLQAPDLGRLVASREQATYLDAQRPVWEGEVAKVAARFAAQGTTLLELEEIRGQALQLARQRSRLGGEIARLESTGLGDFRGSIGELIGRVHDTAMKFEREASHVRSLQAWTLNVTGGYVPPVYGPNTSDFFAVVHFGYNLGGPWHSAAEDRYLDARDEELRTARYEVGRKLQLLSENVKAARTQATGELAIVERRLAEVGEMRAAISASDAPSAVHARARVGLELIALEADRVFLGSLIRELSRLEVK